MDQLKTGKFMKELRKEKGLTQEQLAEKLNVSRRTVSRWETGSNMPDIELLVLLADFFEVDIRELIEGERTEMHMDKEQQEILVQVADYNHQKERLLARKIYAVIVSCIFAWIISLVLLIRFSSVTNGIEIVLFFEVMSILLYSLCMLCVKTNKTASGYISALVGVFVAVILSNLTLLVLFFGTGDYYNYGIVGVYYVFIVFAIIFVSVAIITSVINKKARKT